MPDIRTDADADPDADPGAPADQRRRHRMLLAATLAVVVAVAGAALLQAAGAFDRWAAGESELSRQLAARAVEVLEQAPRSEHGQYLPQGGPADQGNPLDNDPAEFVCAAETFGTDPPDATTLGQVRVVYVHHMCAEVGTGLGWPDAIRAAGPLGVELTDPVTLLVPAHALPDQADATYADRVRAVVPERYHDAALPPDGPVDQDVADEVRQRLG